MSKIFEYLKNKSIFLPVYIFFVLFTFMLCTITTVTTNDIVQEYKNNMNADFKVEYATYVDYRKYNKNSVYYYNMYYEFQDENGNIYSGLKEDVISNEDVAQAMLGEKLLVFVDRETGIIVEDLYFHKTEAIFIGIVAASGYCIMAYCLFWIIVWFIQRLLIYKDGLLDKEIVVMNMQDEKAKSKRRVIVSVICLALFVVCTVFCVKGVIYKQELEVVQVKVDATITEYKEFEDSQGDKYYKIYYTYNDSNLNKRGVWQSSIRSKDYAESKVGKSVKVYLNTKTNSVAVKREYSSQAMFFGICMGITSLIFFGNFMPFLLYVVQKKYFNKYGLTKGE